MVASHAILSLYFSPAPMSFFFSSDFPKAEKAFSVAIVRTEFNEAFVDKLLEITLKSLKKCGIPEEAVEIFSVPGALEIPFLSQKVMQTGDFDGIICLGLVLRGETYHFEIVANEAARGIMELNLEGNIPLINGVLTVNTEEQASARLEKGVDFAKALVNMMNLNQRFLPEE